VHHFFNVYFLCCYMLCSLLQIRFSSVQKVCIWQRNWQSSTWERLRLVLTLNGRYACGSTDASSYITSLKCCRKQNTVYLYYLSQYFQSLAVNPAVPDSVLCKGLENLHVVGLGTLYIDRCIEGHFQFQTLLFGQ
jgi:hypothetical protein